MTTQKIEEIAKEVETEMQMGGLSDGLYMDFAKEVAIRYASQREEEVRQAIREFVESKEKDVSVGGISTATELRVKQQNYDYNRALSDILEYLETLEKKQ